MLGRKGSVMVFIAALGISASSVQAQQLGKEALSSFPAGTVQVQYSSPAALRKLPNYDSLRQHYMGAWLKELETSLVQLGIKESDVDELVLGWASGASQKQPYGLATGRFDATVLGERAAERHIAPDSIGGKTGYCLGAGLETPCVVLLGSNLGAFGTLSSLSEMMDVRGGARPSLGSDANVAKIVNDLESAAPIWGIATDGAVAQWFQNWMPTQHNIQLDWAQVFQNVDNLGYKVQAAQDVQLQMDLYCKSTEAAGSLRQVLEGLKLAQQLAWQSEYPNQANPFSGMAIAESGTDISIQLTASYSDLSAAGSMGAAPQGP
ncbi:MAG: hypothetical protein M1423_04065 [Acidobacteria bacterium]|nr:hypothetical protein [Acidobacteriota bacterium]